MGSVVMRRQPQLPGTCTTARSPRTSTRPGCRRARPGAIEKRLRGDRQARRLRRLRSWCEQVVAHGHRHPHLDRRAAVGIVGRLGVADEVRRQLRRANGPGHPNVGRPDQRVSPPEAMVSTIRFVVHDGGPDGPPRVIAWRARGRCWARPVRERRARPMRDRAALDDRCTDRGEHNRRGTTQPPCSQCTGADPALRTTTSACTRPPTSAAGRQGDSQLDAVRTVGALSTPPAQSSPEPTPRAVVGVRPAQDRRPPRGTATAPATHRSARRAASGPDRFAPPRPPRRGGAISLSRSTCRRHRRSAAACRERSRGGGVTRPCSAWSRARSPPPRSGSRRRGETVRATLMRGNVRRRAGERGAPRSHSVAPHRDARSRLRVARLRQPVHRDSPDQPAGSSSDATCDHRRPPPRTPVHRRDGLVITLGDQRAGQPGELSRTAPRSSVVLRSRLHLTMSRVARSACPAVRVGGAGIFRPVRRSPYGRLERQDHRGVSGERRQGERSVRGAPLSCPQCGRQDRWRSQPDHVPDRRRRQHRRVRVEGRRTHEPRLVPQPGGEPRRSRSAPRHRGRHAPRKTTSASASGPREAAYSASRTTSNAPTGPSRSSSSNGRPERRHRRCNRSANQRAGAHDDAANDLATPWP